jgi:hypothetical protein
LVTEVKTGQPGVFCLLPVLLFQAPENCLWGACLGKPIYFGPVWHIFFAKKSQELANTYKNYIINQVRWRKEKRNNRKTIT